MTLTSGIWNQHPATAVSLASAKPTTAAATSASTGNADASASDTSTTISANDFLTLLVTEMQNQDPTADTDPNEYINQLVNVNSLEQLISINQTLTTATSSTGSTTTDSSGSSTGAAGTRTAKIQAQSAGSTTPTQQLKGASQTGSSAKVESAGTGKRPAASITQGNLGAPASNPSAQRVANSLGGRDKTYSPLHSTQ
jgi:flagellar basal-body rod modification protein FlgD